MKIAFIGSRGIPANYGGFETFVEEVAVSLSKNYNYNVVVVGDSRQKEELNSKISCQIQGYQESQPSASPLSAFF